MADANRPFKINRFLKEGNFSRYWIAQEYRSDATFESTTQWTVPPTGRILPNGQGFGFNTSRPQMSFKTYRALANVGLSNDLDDTLSKRSRSTITPDYVWDSASHYLDATVPRIDHPYYEECINRLRKVLRTDIKIRPISLNEALIELPQSTSPGLPFIKTHPGLKKGAIINRYKKSFNTYWDRVGNGQSTPPLPDCAGFARTHISTPNVNKVRLVWAYPLLAVSAEARFASPLTKLLLKQDIGHEIAYGMEMMKGGMTWLNSQLLKIREYEGGQKIFMTDYTRFDTNVPAWLIRDIFQVISEKFEMTQADKLIFKRIVNYFINTPVLNMDGRRLVKDHGVPSGSMFTNLVDTLVNMVITWFTSEITFGKQPMFNMYFGDDAILSYHQSVKIDVENFSKAVNYYFGQQLNVKKSFWTTRIQNAHFLGYYNNGGTPVKPTYELISSMLFPQYNKDDWSYCISRALGCLLASAGADNTIFRAAQGVYNMAAAKPGSIESGILQIRENNRSKRFLTTLGHSDTELTHHYFTDIVLSVPQENCTKIKRGINVFIKTP